MRVIRGAIVIVPLALAACGLVNAWQGSDPRCSSLHKVFDDEPLRQCTCFANDDLFDEGDFTRGHTCDETTSSEFPMLCCGTPDRTKNDGGCTCAEIACARDADGGCECSPGLVGLFGGDAVPEDTCTGTLCCQTAFDCFCDQERADGCNDGEIVDSCSNTMEFACDSGRDVDDVAFVSCSEMVEK